MCAKTEEEKLFLPWADIEPHVARWHREGIEYLSKIWPSLSERKAANDTWGDEVESQLVRFDKDSHEVHLVLEQKEVLSCIDSNAPEGTFDPEFAQYMVETSPREPYISTVSSLLEVQGNLEARRAKVNRLLPKNEKLMTLSVFPLLGIESPIDTRNNQHVDSYDNAISDGPYSFAKDNIEARAKRGTSIEVPVYQDVCTTLPKMMELKHILYGPGACGLQATFQCKTLTEARSLHDQFIVLGPIFLALTAATPIYQGVLVDTDARWNQTAAAVDDRPEHEFGRLYPRWSTAPMYLSKQRDIGDSGLNSDLINVLRQDTNFLESHGMDSAMAQYFAYLHLHDPLYLNATRGRHEHVTPEDVHRSICESVWSHVRLKVPEPNAADQGWRVEFRPMEVQFTDFDNAAFLIFLDLVRQVLAWMGPKLDFYMPLELVRENMDRAHARDAVVKQKFWFPGHVVQDTSSGEGVKLNNHGPDIPEWTVDEIINGRTKGDAAFPGLLPLVERYLKEKMGQDSEQLHPYLDLIRRRANGQDVTPAHWMRSFVHCHPTYERDSRISQRACYDMLQEAERMRIHASSGSNSSPGSIGN
ncbi:GCS-domain-containing protein [Rhizodiscina lignyota]|uniref:Glutamate--cysteine ligase n=1 Tax=Rhizodiscina lignyota TaxID=1504668 RepID=A0A9P4I8S8_9PEZI|nr:GCS-domain-containing protein [Rhizodiscina lignyota]